MFCFTGNPLRCDQDLKWVCDVNVGLFGKVWFEFPYTKCAAPDDKRGLSVKAFCEA